jgi:hypothetical protein
LKYGAQQRAGCRVQGVFCTPYFPKAHPILTESNMEKLKNMELHTQFRPSAHAEVPFLANPMVHNLSCSMFKCKKNMKIGNGQNVSYTLIKNTLLIELHNTLCDFAVKNSQHNKFTRNMGLITDLYKLSTQYYRVHHINIFQINNHPFKI